MPKRKKSTVEKVVEKFGGGPPLSSTDVNIAIAEGIVRGYKREAEARLQESKPQPITDETLCNHRNMHTENQILCTLKPGHPGNHSDGKSEWSDAAGTPVKKHG